MRLVGCFATHYHIDHTGGFVPPEMQAFVLGPFGAQVMGGCPRLEGFAEMYAEYGCKLYAHALEVGTVARQCGLESDAITPCEQGTRLSLGEGHVEVLHTPGHSGGSICLCVRDSTDTIRMVLSGDTVFPGSCGRLTASDSSVSAMFDSLAKLRALDDPVPVYPGHAYHGDYTTIGRERMPSAGPWPSGILQPFTREQFVEMFAVGSGSK